MVLNLFKLPLGIKAFIKSESAVGILLFAVVILATLIVNSSFAANYHNFFTATIPLNISWFGIYKEMDLRMWVNDAFMAIFFLLVGLELKREILIGELSSVSRMILPLAGAVGGVILPALIYANINFNNEINLRGWAIPTATDIVFAVGVLTIFGNKISNSLKIFLVALAVIDDLIAILIIAIFYTHNLVLIYLDFSLVILLILFVLNSLKINNLWPYIIFGAILWVLILKSGIHPTIAGILLAFFIPTNSKKIKISPLQKLQSCLHFPVNYLILPIFTFANAGIIFSNFSSEIFYDPLFMGIVLGLFFGKQLGIMLAIFMLVKLKLAKFFKDVTWIECYGITIIAGIGFTMSLFIGGLAFEANPALMSKVLVAVVAGSLLSIIFGFLVIFLAVKHKNKNSKILLSY